MPVPAQNLLQLDAFFAPNEEDPTAAPQGVGALVEHIVQSLAEWHALLATEKAIQTRMENAAAGSPLELLYAQLINLEPVSTIQGTIQKLILAPDDTPLVLGQPLHENQAQHLLDKFARCEKRRMHCEREIILHYNCLRAMLARKQYIRPADLSAMVAQARARLPPRSSYFCDCPTSPHPQRTLEDVWRDALAALPVHVGQRTATWLLRHGHGTPLPPAFPLWLGSAVAAHHARARVRDEILRWTGVDKISTVGQLKKQGKNTLSLLTNYALWLPDWLATKHALDAFVDQSLPALAASGLPIAVLDEWLPRAHVGDEFCDKCQQPLGLETPPGATRCAFCPPSKQQEPVADHMEVSPSDDVIPYPQFLSQPSV
jgi:hypothetical protein